jgi:hypothetical protein
MMNLNNQNRSCYAERRNVILSAAKDLTRGQPDPERSEG